MLVACEYSARVRGAFRSHGHDAWSCDLLECEADPQWHLQQPVESVLADGWDLMVAHPPCTHLAVSGSRHFHRKQCEQVKTTCLWLKNLPALKPTQVVDGREARVHLMPPGPNRWKERSRTYQGIADAMGQQWGTVTLPPPMQQLSLAI